MRAAVVAIYQAGLGGQLNFPQQGLAGQSAEVAGCFLRAFD
jgi:hypothetical protein